MLCLVTLYILPQDSRSPLYILFQRQPFLSYNNLFDNIFLPPTTTTFLHILPSNTSYLSTPLNLPYNHP